MEEFVHKKIPLKIKKIHPDAVVPSYAHDGDMCFDLTAVSVEYDEKTDSYIYHTGLQMELGYGYGANLVPRSKNVKTECYLANIATKGLNFSEDEPIGETVRKLRENAKDGKTTMNPMDFAPYKVGDRMCQMEIIKVIQADIIVSDELSEPKRGNGFGSSGD